MERKIGRTPTELTGIHINLEQGAIEFEDRHGTIGRLLFRNDVTYYEGRPLLVTPRHPTEQPARGRGRRRRTRRPSPHFPEPGSPPQGTGR